MKKGKSDVILNGSMHRFFMVAAFATAMGMQSGICQDAQFPPIESTIYSDSFSLPSPANNRTSLGAVTTILEIVDAVIEIAESKKTEGEDSQLEETLTLLNEVEGKLQETNRKVNAINSDLLALQNQIHLSLSQVLFESLKKDIDGIEQKILNKYVGFDQFFFDFNDRYPTNDERREAMKSGTFTADYLSMMKRITNAESGAITSEDLDAYLDARLSEIQGKMCGKLNTPNAGSLIDGYAALLIDRMKAGESFSSCADAFASFMSDHLSKQYLALSMIREWYFAQPNDKATCQANYDAYKNKYISSYLRPQLDSYYRSWDRLLVVYVQLSNPCSNTSTSMDVLQTTSNSKGELVFSPSVAEGKLAEAHLLGVCLLSQSAVFLNITMPKYECAISSSQPSITFNGTALTETETKSRILNSMRIVPGYLLWHGSTCVPQNELVFSSYPLSISQVGTFPVKITFRSGSTLEGNVTVSCYDRKTGQTATASTPEADKVYFGLILKTFIRELPKVTFSSSSNEKVDIVSTAPHYWDSIKVNSVNSSGSGAVHIAMTGLHTGLYHFQTYFRAKQVSESFTLAENSPGIQIRLSGSERIYAQGAYSFSLQAKAAIGISGGFENKTVNSPFSNSVNVSEYANSLENDLETPDLIVSAKTSFQFLNILEYDGKRWGGLDDKTGFIDYGVYFNDRLHLSLNLINMDTAQGKILQTAGKTMRGSDSSLELTLFSLNDRNRQLETIVIPSLPVNENWEFLSAADPDSDGFDEIFCYDPETRSIQILDYEYSTDDTLTSQAVVNQVYVLDEGFELHRINRSLLSTNNLLVLSNSQDHRIRTVSMTAEMTVQDYNLPETTMTDFILTDLNHDSQLELFCFSPEGEWLELYTQVDGKYQIDSILPAQPGKITAVADFDGNGTDDLLWEREEPYLAAMTLLDSELNLVEDAGSIQLKPNLFRRGFRIATLGDFNGDGKCDLIWKRDGKNKPELYITFMDGLTILKNNKQWQSGIIRFPGIEELIQIIK